MDAFERSAAAVSLPLHAGQRHDVGMWQRRRSWFERPRWWADYSLSSAMTAAVMVAWGGLGAPGMSWGEVAAFSLLLPVAATWREQREYRPWEQLEMSSTATRAQLEAAEAVVRYDRASSDPVVLDQALRIIQLARRQAGSPATGLTIAAVAAAALVLVAVVSNALWPLPAAAVGLLLAAWEARWTSVLRRRQAQLHEQLAAAGLDVGSRVATPTSGG